MCSVLCQFFLRERTRHVDSNTNMSNFSVLLNSHTLRVHDLGSEESNDHVL